MNPNNPYDPQAYPQPSETPVPQTPPPYQTLPTVESSSVVQPQQVSPEAQPTPQPYAQPQNQQPYAAPQQYGQASAPNPQAPPPRNMGAPADVPRTPPPRPRQYGKTPLPVRMMDWTKKNWWAPVVGVVILAIVGVIIFQIAQPSNALPQGTVVSGMDVGGMDKNDAITALNEAYGKVEAEIYFGDSTVPYAIPSAEEIGVSVDNTSRLEGVSYPLWLRLIPSSYFWASSLNNIGEGIYNYDKAALDTYALQHLGDDCVIEPQNANLKLEDDRFTVVRAVAGGTCNLTEFKDAASKAQIEDGKITIRTSIDETPAPLTDDIAQQMADELNHNLSRDMPLQAGGQTENVPVRTVRGWLTFRAVIPEDDTPPRLAMVVDKERLRTYFNGTIASRVEKKPGVTRVATTDYRVTARSEGAAGVLINLDETIRTIEAFIGRRADRATVSTGPVAPSTKYDRTYTPTEEGFRALIEQFAEDNEGKIGIVFQEMSGSQPHTSGAANQGMVMKGSGLEATYLAYAAQAGIEDGSIQPTDRIQGAETVEGCITAAIAKNDFLCARALLDKVGNAKVDERMRELGMTGTSFSGADNVTTAHDAALFTRKLIERDFVVRKNAVLESPMRNKDLRDGFNRSSGNVVSFAGEDGDNYSEAGYITGKGRYYLSFVSEGASADTAAKLVRAIDELREEKAALSGR